MDRWVGVLLKWGGTWYGWNMVLIYDDMPLGDPSCDHTAPTTLLQLGAMVSIGEVCQNGIINLFEYAVEYEVKQKHQILGDF